MPHLLQREPDLVAHTARARHVRRADGVGQDGGEQVAPDAEGVVSLMVGAYLGELVRNGKVEPDWLDRTLELLWTLMAAPADDA